MNVCVVFTLGLLARNQRNVGRVARLKNSAAVNFEYVRVYVSSGAQKRHCSMYVRCA